MKSFTRHKKLHAFTLLELLVGMILSGIVLTATFSAFHIATRQYETYNQNSESTTELSFFISQLQSDFSNATALICTSENEIEMQAENHNLKYHFTEKNVLRTDINRTDTFRVSVNEIIPFLKSQKVTEENSAFDELHVVVNINEKKEETIFLQTADAKSKLSVFDTSE